MFIRPVRGRYLQSADSNIIQPQAGHAVLVNNYVTGTQSGGILVQVQKPNLSSAAHYFCTITNPGAVVAWPATWSVNTPAGFFDLTSTDGVTFSNANCMVTGLPPASPTGNNKIVNVKAYDAGSQPLTPDAAGFIAVAPAYTVTVDARCCLWLAYAPSGLTLAPYGETTLAASPYLPIPLFVPDAPAVAVHVRAPGGPWDHGGPASDADGNGNLVPLQRPDLYKNDPRLNSGNIDGSAPLPLNKLVGMWSYGAQNPTAEMAVGKTADIQIPTRPARPEILYLAFHDGYEWSNNHGAMQGQVSWS